MSRPCSRCVRSAAAGPARRAACSGLASCCSVGSAKNTLHLTYCPHPHLHPHPTTTQPYLYGRVTEVAVDQSGCTQAVKHLAMGRGSIEMASRQGCFCPALLSP